MSSPKNSSEVLFGNAIKKHSAGKHFDTQKICKRILKSNPKDAEALNLIAVSYLNTGQNQKALSAMEKAYALNPTNLNFQNNFASIITVNIKAMAQNITGVTNDNSYMSEFGRLLGMVNFDAPNDDTPIIKDAIFICLQNKDISNVPFAKAYVSILGHDKIFDDILALTVLDDFERQAKELDKLDLEGFLNDPYLCAGLKTYNYFNANLELIFTLIRKYYLLKKINKVNDVQPFFAALAEHSDLNEYIFFIEDAEEKTLKDLISNLNIPSNKAFDDTTISHLLLIGCYMSLDDLEQSEDISKDAHLSNNKDLDAIVHYQIDKAAERRNLQGDIPSITKIENDTSRNVQKQYETNPYPRWQQAQKPELTKELTDLGDGLDILIAGCGTGKEAIELAHIYPKANVTGIDLSLASLSYGKQKAIELGVENIKFIQADILKLEKLEQQFDLIASGGVLHHMENPLAGWNSLLSVLKPDGVMKIELYSELARKSVVECRELISKRNLKATPQDIRKLRRDIIEMDDSEPLKNIQTFSDFSNMSMLRDLVFHVQEHRYTVPRIQSELDTLGLSLISLTSNLKGIMEHYSAAYPDDPEHNNLEYWNQFEENNPDAFRLMYSILCNRNGDKKPDWLFIR